MTPEEGYTFEFGAEKCALRMTWGALLDIYEQWGEGHLVRIQEAIKSHNLADLAVILQACGGPPLEDIIKASPPINRAIDAVEVMFTQAYEGHEAGRVFRELKRKEAEARQRDVTGAKKLSSLFRGIFSLGTRLKTRWQRG